MTDISYKLGNKKIGLITIADDIVSVAENEDDLQRLPIVSI